MIEALILDWAGTMADDLPVTLAATNRTLEAFGGEAIDLATYRREFRIPVTEFYGPRTNNTSLEELDRVFFDSYRDASLSVGFFEGVEDLLRVNHARGRRLFVLSTVPTAILEAALESKGLLDLFEGIYGDAADKRLVMPRLLEERGLAPDRCLFVGDTAHDVETARASGVRAGAALYGYSLEADLRAAGPDYLFAAAGDIAIALDREYLMDTVPLVIPTVGGVLVDPQGRILLVRTTKWSGTYGIPGGKIDYGETMLEAYRREIREETGLEARNCRFVMIQDCVESPEFVKKRHFLLINYISDVDSPESTVTNYEIEDSVWTTPAEAMKMNLNQPTRLVLDEAARLGWLDLEEEATS